MGDPGPEVGGSRGQETGALAPKGRGGAVADRVPVWATAASTRDTAWGTTGPEGCQPLAEIAAPGSTPSRSSGGARGASGGAVSGSRELKTGAKVCNPSPSGSTGGSAGGSTPRTAAKSATSSSAS
ncbi:hypothetical protein P3T76_015952 [Phytophthora citrophthora]|uniref:Uncharacterized protein n=1 Tax=Phytophthora citrophthora TaxID=4793 RepID=A0AAD9FYJ9_9STRA|nr:hypothetical protein P3T76_015952 [Phytophthora citrophthora]